MVTSYKLWKSICLRNELPPKKLKYWVFLKITILDVAILKSITNPPLYDYLILSPHIHLSSHSFQENWHDHKKFWTLHQIPLPSLFKGDDAMQSLDIRYHGQVPSRKISEKRNDPILKELCVGRTDRQTDKNDFIGRCPTDVKRPKKYKVTLNIKKGINSIKPI